MRSNVPGVVKFNNKTNDGKILKYKCQIILYTSSHREISANSKFVAYAWAAFWGPGSWIGIIMITKNGRSL